MFIRLRNQKTLNGLPDSMYTKNLLYNEKTLFFLCPIDFECDQHMMSRLLHWSSHPRIAIHIASSEPRSSALVLCHRL